MAEENRIVQYTTPTLQIKLKNCIDLSSFREVHVTFAQRGITLDIDNPNILSENTLSIELTQEQTSKFTSHMPIDVMINLITPAGKRFANKEPIVVMVTDNLLKRVIE